MSAPAQAPNGAGDAKDPSGFLSEIIGAPVTVKLNSGVVYKGWFGRAVWSCIVLNCGPQVNCNRSMDT